MSFSSSHCLYRLLIDSSQWCGAIRKRMRKTFSRVETETLLREATDRSINVNIIFVGIIPQQTQKSLQNIGTGTKN